MRLRAGLQFAWHTCELGIALEHLAHVVLHGVNDLERGREEKERDGLVLEKDSGEKEREAMHGELWRTMSVLITRSHQTWVSLETSVCPLSPVGGFVPEGPKYLIAYMLFTNPLTARTLSRTPSPSALHQGQAFPCSPHNKIASLHRRLKLPMRQGHPINECAASHHHGTYRIDLGLHGVDLRVLLLLRAVDVDDGGQRVLRHRPVRLARVGGLRHIGGWCATALYLLPR